MGRKKYRSVQEANLESGCSGFDPVTLIASNRVGNINYKRGSGDRPGFLQRQLLRRQMRYASENKIIWCLGCSSHTEKQRRGGKFSGKMLSFILTRATGPLQLFPEKKRLKKVTFENRLFIAPKGKKLTARLRIGAPQVGFQVAS